MVAAFGFYDFSGVRIFINLQLTRLTAASLGLYCWSATTGLWIKQIDHFLQAVTVLSEQGAELRFKFNFFLEASIAFQGFESLKLLGQVFFELAEFCEFGPEKSLCG